MENKHDDYGFPMPPVSWGALGSFAEIMAENFFPDTLEEPRAIDFKKLMNFTMPVNGFDVYPVSHEELPGQYAVTEPTTIPHKHTIKMRVDLFDDIDLYGGSAAHLAVATLLHEFGHCLLNHDLRLGRLLQYPKGQALLARKKTSEIKPYESAESQAWCLAGHLAMPRRTIAMISNPSISKLSEIYQVSTDFAQSHIRRLRMILPVN